MPSKRTSIILQLLIMALSASPCHAQGKGGQVVVSQSGTTYVNQKKIVVGIYSDDISYKRVTTIIKGKGRVQEVVRDCGAIAAIRLNGDEQAADPRVNNVTIINRDTIEMHTKAMVEKYRYEIQNAEHPNRPYQYLRFLGMMSEGEGNKLINEGVIDIIFDHDPTVDFRVYGFGICGNANSAFINRGQIRFLGKGTPLTRMRGMGSMADNVTFLNEGTISVDVDMSEDARMITTGGDYNDIINNGMMVGCTSGTLIGMTRYGNSHISNNGTIALTVTKMPVGYKTILANTEKFACGLMEMLNAKRTIIPPMNNRGTITIDFNDIGDPAWMGYGMYFGMVSPCDANVTINNLGNIRLLQSGAVAYRMAEAGFINRTGKDAATHITVGKWQTTFRDFGTTKDLFIGNHVSMDFGKADFQLETPQGYARRTSYSVAPSALLYNTDPSTTNEYVGYGNASYTAASSGWQVSVDATSQTLLLDNKQDYR